jgi:hypothetical protein
MRQFRCVGIAHVEWPPALAPLFRRQDRPDGEPGNTDEHGEIVERLHVPSPILIGLTRPV